MSETPDIDDEIEASRAPLLDHLIELRQRLIVCIGALAVGCLGVLRPLKGWLVAEQYVHKAREADWASTGRHGEGGFVFDRRKASGG